MCSSMVYLELEEVFAFKRDGEYDKFSPYREKQGKKSCFHGMFVKGICFADLVNRSAQCYFSNRKIPVGLMLLSEVALGEVYEFTSAKPPVGKHSTKCLGMNVPHESGFVKWRGDVVVTCGKLMSTVKASRLLYNEYIVYNPAQASFSPPIE